MAAEYLYWSGLIVYAVNYLIGWLLYFHVISMNKRTHQIFYSLIIINLIVLLFFIQFLSVRFFLVLASLVLMLILPMGRKGGIFHRVGSTVGLICYALAWS